jgi:hypothetical protein
VLKIDGKVRNLPGGLRAILVENDQGVLDPEARQIGGVAAAGAALAFFVFSAVFRRFRYFLRRIRFSALLYCLLISSLLHK